jgi:hypothetical protein
MQKNTATSIKTFQKYKQHLGWFLLATKVVNCKQLQKH